MTTFANRGRGLEHAVKELFKQYEKLGIHCQQNHPEQLHDGTLVRKHGFDFQIFHNGTFYAFDCKECAPKNWPLDKAKPHQLKALLDVEKQGGQGFFLVYFKQSGQLVKFSARMIQCQLEMGHKTVSPEMGEATSMNLLGIQEESK